MGKRREIFVVFSLASILVLAGFAANEKAYAGAPIVDPPCSMFAEWSTLVGTDTGSTPTLSGSEPCPAATGPLSPPASAATLQCNASSPFSTFCTATLPNFDDDLSKKLIHIEIEYDENLVFFGTTPGTFPFGPTSTVGSDATDGAVVCTEISAGPAGPPGSGLFEYFIECLPNPDSEIITLAIPNVQLFSIEFFTHSFDDTPIGGTFVPIDQSALLLAGVQSISMWMIPVVIAGIGIGIFMIKLRK